MDGVMIGVLAGATVINFISIQWKIKKGDGMNAAVDVFVFGLMLWMFMGTLGGMIIAVSASAFFSVWLLIVPFKFGFKMPDLGLDDMMKDLESATHTKGK